ncbi:MAG: hypothetical protein PHV93_01790 [Candidatus Pacebacteria bacterium]|nr:hypothetical protein [Candidatus Paceibacterota bacterium]
MKKGGFTLIETILYIGLLSLILGGILSASYYLIESSGRQSQSILVDEELNFLFKKIDWVLSSVSSIDAPLGPGVSTKLIVRKYNFSTNPLTLVAKDGLLTLSRSNKEAIPLNSESVKVDSVSFSYISPTSSDSPPGIQVVIQIGSRFATSTYYVR